MERQVQYHVLSCCAFDLPGCSGRSEITSFHQYRECNERLPARNNNPSEVGNGDHFLNMPQHPQSHQNAEQRSMAITEGTKTSGRSKSSLSIKDKGGLLVGEENMLENFCQNRAAL